MPVSIDAKAKNPNHPAKGAQIKVEPIKKEKDIKAIKRLLAGNPRDLALFTLGINTNLRASDLVRITIGQVRGAVPGHELTLKEKKTGKPRRITLNQAVTQALAAYLEARAGCDDEPLFRGRGGGLAVPSVSRLVKTWCRAINLKGNYASHTLRKTWGFHQRVRFGVGIAELMECFRHSSQRQTLDYLCVQPEEIKEIYCHEI